MDLPDDYKNFLKRNKEVKAVSWNNDGHTLTIRLKSGREEKYDLDIKEQKDKLEKRYGKLPEAPPPPPPVEALPPTPPVEQ